MKIGMVETIRTEAAPAQLWVRLWDADGVTGLGETNFAARSAEAYVHEYLAPQLFELGDVEIEPAWRTLEPYLGYQGVGLEIRSLAAIDVALWDLEAKHRRRPLYQLLGTERARPIRLYNTCAGPQYGQKGRLGRPSAATEPESIDDLVLARTRPEHLAGLLLEDGLTAMKFWPFDVLASGARPVHLTDEEVAIGVALVERVRRAHGDAIDVLVELHGLWDQATAAKILRRLEPFRPYWVEDCVRPDDTEAIRALARSSEIALAGGETLAAPRDFRELVEAGVRFPIIDPTWAGGVTGVLRVLGDLPARHHVLHLHDCTGPVSLAVCAHLGTSVAGSGIQEFVRSYYFGWYRDLVDGLPEVRDGAIQVLETPGIGTALKPLAELRKTGTVVRRVSRLQQHTVVPYGGGTPSGAAWTSAPVPSKASATDFERDAD